MSERKVMEQALEALKDLQLCTDDYYESSHEASKKGDKAITAIKEALSSPNGEAQRTAAEGEDINLSCKSTQARLATSWGYVKAQPEQRSVSEHLEPVAWSEFVELACAQIKAADDAAADRDYMLDSDDCIRVLRGEWKGGYLNDQPTRPNTPPQRKPLTDEQIAEMWQQYNPLHGIASFARAIEAAHGIGSETTLVKEKNV